MTQPLLMLDLDNTLVDRDAAFRAAVTDFLAEHGVNASEVDWLMSVDASGYAARGEVAKAMAERFGPATSEAAIRELLDHGSADRVVLAESTRVGLRRAVDAGWLCAIVTNGRIAQQETKIRVAGLDELVHGWTISERVGVGKPAPEMFRAAAAAVGTTLDSAWMVGDSAHADIAGAYALGLPSVWVSAGRDWSEPSYRPTHIAHDIAAAIAHVLEPSA